VFAARSMLTDNHVANPNWFLLFTCHEIFYSFFFFFFFLNMIFFFFLRFGCHQFLMITLHLDFLNFIFHFKLNSSYLTTSFFFFFISSYLTTSIYKYITQQINKYMCVRERYK
jgi:hypothetical protein